MRIACLRVCVCVVYKYVCVVVEDVKSVYSSLNIFLHSTQGHPQPMINQQPAHQQSSRNQSASAEEHNNISNGSMSMNSLQRKLTPLPDPPTSGNHIPYQLQKALVQGKMIPCINMKPYVYTELLVTLPDLVSNFFNNMPVQSCHQVMSVLGIELYKGNK